MSDRTAPDVSVVMSCYNAEAWLAEAIDSVLAQTLRSLELILVDDGSRDRTPGILRRYAAQDARCVIVSKPNTGLSDSLNVGIERARGAWIARLDADDIAAPERLRTQLDFLHAHPDVVLLGTGFHEIDEAGRILRTHEYPQTHRELERVLSTLRGFCPHSSVMYRRDLVADGNAYNVVLSKAQDWDLWCRLAERGQIASLRAPLVQIRKHGAQLSFAADGASQLAEQTAAATAHLLRLRNAPDPLWSPLHEDRHAFIAWVDRRLHELGYVARRRTWLDARNRLVAAGIRTAPLIQFTRSLIASGHAMPLLLEKAAGTRLPRQLAHEWARTARVPA